jgi:hypothetical protein
MIEINMSQLAKKVVRVGESWVSYMDTYGQITKEEIIKMDKEGYDLIQIAKNNTHLRFNWEKRN